MTCIFRSDALYKCTKPYQYIGGEFLSYNKDFDSAKLKFAFAFPDKYEIGISNFGLRILYDIVNKNPDYMADRVYAPEPDFKFDVLYGLESKKPISEFDAVGLSLQYEMSYPTVLKLLEMSDIPYRNDLRDDNHPIIVAGGPCTYNPLPMSDFIDIFMIGDGEDLIKEVCEVLLKTKGMPRHVRIKELCKIEGIWSAIVGGQVNKRVSQFSNDTTPSAYPIPFSTSVQDRAVVEIRRGCTRMCRFCQAGHVSLPIREREAEDIIKISKELVKNTGYDEYSLLSLSSNDYTNIIEVIKELSVDFDEKKVSLSLPSQRIDGFNIELANLVQSVRKSTITLAPEAGSQRLRNVIKKNITEDMIIDAVLTLYVNGWSRIKFYFMCGLPTETIQDMEEMANLLSKIKYRCKMIKREKGLKHSMDITCTLSIFVPKPFTPFQWCPQMSFDKITEHIKYLREKTAHIKGVKINYHEEFMSLIEAVLTRGDKSISKYIEALYKKGCYLDAWWDYFKEDVWKDCAQELGLDLNKLAQKEFKTDEVLPWDFINTGLDKSWLVNEYNRAFQDSEQNVVPTCETGCVNCGVCKNLNVKKVLAKPYISKSKPKELQKHDVSYKYRLKITKKGNLKFLSHLDWLNTFLKALARTDLNVAYSQGFNPMMKVSVGIALPLFVESDGELTDIELYDDVSPDKIKNDLQKVLPDGAEIISVDKIEKKSPSIDVTAQWAEYSVEIFDKSLYDFENFVYNTNRVLSSQEIYIEKRNKKGLLKQTDIKPSIKSYEFRDDSLYIVLKTGQSTIENSISALRADVLMKLIAPDVVFNITRTRFFDSVMNEL